MFTGFKMISGKQWFFQWFFQCFKETHGFSNVWHSWLSRPCPEDWLLWLAAIRIGCEKSLELQRELQLRPMAAAPDGGGRFSHRKVAVFYCQTWGSIEDGDFKQGCEYQKSVWFKQHWGFWIHVPSWAFPAARWQDWLVIFLERLMEERDPALLALLNEQVVVSWFSKIWGSVVSKSGLWLQNVANYLYIYMPDSGVFNHFIYSYL